MKSKLPGLPIPGSTGRGLTVRLFVWVILPIILLLFIATFGSFALHQREMRQMVGVLDERAVQTAASSIAEQLENRAVIIEGLSLMTAEGNLEEDIFPASPSFMSNFEYGFAIFSPDGDILASKNWIITNLPKQLENSLAQSSEKASFSQIYSPSENEQKIIFVTAAATVNAPIMVGAFNPSTLVGNSIEDAFELKEQASISLIDSFGEVLYTSEEDNINRLENFNENRLENQSGFYFIQDNDEKVLAYSAIPNVGWTLILEEPWVDVASPTLTTTLITPLALTPVLLLALLALWFGAKQVVQPLQKLEDRARELAWGDYHKIQESVGGIEEIVLLQNSLIYLAEKVQAANEGLRSYIGAITTGQEDERKRLARELHDETIQTLIALNQQVQLAQVNNKNGDMATRLTEIENISQKTIRDLRRLTQALRPLYLDDLGLVTALKMLVSETEKTNPIEISFQHIGTERRLPPETEMALYRIAQEGLSNILRHSNAKNASLKIDFSPASISITLSDDGVGFTLPENPAGFARSGHFGILGLHERAELIAAKLTITSNPGQGTGVLVVLPAEDPNHLPGK